MKLIIESGLKPVILCDECFKRYQERRPDIKSEDITGKTPPEQRCDVCRSIEVKQDERGFGI